jgi:hypothetical protein
MRSLSWLLPFVFSLVATLLATGTKARGEEPPREYRTTINKGLEYLARSQHKDGHWEGVNGRYTISVTSLCGLAMLCEGSTLREGKYRDNLRRAADYLVDRVQVNGLIGVATRQAEGGRYMYGHGFGLLFLSCLIGEEDTARRRERLLQICEKAAKYSLDAQTSRGGWGYLSARDGDHFDEGSVTITQVQALRAARNAGIIVPPDVIKKAQKYLRDSTNTEGGIRYSLCLPDPSTRPALTAAAVACGFSFGEYNSDLVKKWIKTCQAHLPTPGAGRRTGHEEYTHYYFAQVVYVLGEDRYKKLFPDARSDEVLSWKKYRKTLFDEFKRIQSADGSWSADSWTARMVGPVYVTACYLTILQLDKGTLPIYQR